jgi:predicted transcriptional regulator
MLKKRIMFRLEMDQLKALEKVAKEEDRSVSYLVRHIIQQWMTTSQTKDAQLNRNPSKRKI